MEDQIHGEGTTELFEAQSFIYKHVFSFMDSMSLKSAVQLGIPDAIHNHNRPITLPELASAIKAPPEKTSHLHQLMRLLVCSGFFATKKVDENEEGYVLTPPSRLLVRGHPTSLAPIVLAMVDPVLVTPWHFLGNWLQGNDSTPFATAHGMDFWSYANRNPEFTSFMGEMMAADSRMMSLAIRDCKEIFEGLSSLVDVGGGTGTMVRAICEAFPHLKCTVLDLPQVVANLPKAQNLDYVGGDMFQSIPSADAIFIKSVMHNWNDEDCVKILKRCREAIPSRAEGGKVIIIDLVLSTKKDEHDELTKTKLFNDMMMMVLVAGKERCQEEWEKLFLEAGFSHFKITPRFGIPDIIHNHASSPVSVCASYPTLKDWLCPPIMLVLAHSGFFAITKVYELEEEEEEEEEGYILANLSPESSNLEYAGECVLHDWSDENCVKILKKCREATPSEEEGGKVIIVDTVINEKKDEKC